MNRDEMLKKITILDFMAVDLQLYLDTHPWDRDAIKEYNKINETSCQIKEDYEALFGPICSFRSLSNEDYWGFVQDEPFPWEEGFNINICGGGW